MLESNHVVARYFRQLGVSVSSNVMGSSSIMFGLQVRTEYMVDWGVVSHLQRDYLSFGQV